MSDAHRLSAFLVVILFAWPSCGEAVVAFDAASTAQFDGVSSFSYTHTPVGTPTTAVVEVGIRSDGLTDFTVSSITYGGTAMTFVRRDFTTLVQSSEVWLINNPAAGAQTVAVTLSAAAEGASIAVTVTGSATSGQPANNAGATGDSTAPTVNVTSATGRLVLGFVQSERTNTDAQITPGAGQTQRASIDGPTVNRPRMEATDEAGAATVTTSWTFVSAQDWAAQGVDLSEPGAAAGFAEREDEPFEDESVVPWIRHRG